jgi:iron complex transport system ATP-binding protein
MGRLGAEDREMVDRAIGEVGLERYRERPLDHLSDGERQRVMIARAFVQDTPVMLLDEPAAYLDIPNKYGLIRILAGFRDRGKTILFSTHDLETAMMYADRFWVIQDGAIREGAPEDLGLEGLFNRLFDSSGIGFDAPSARFRISPTLRGTIGLEGDHSDALLWTGRMLERLGFRVSRSGGERKVSVDSTGGNHVWLVTGDQGEEKFSSIYLLARFLTEDS